jgi:hypothetical protein
VEVSVRDDGVGRKAQPPDIHHYGLTIMHERAETLGGDLRVVSPEAGGTEVRLTFVPNAARRDGTGDRRLTAASADPGRPRGVSPEGPDGERVRPVWREGPGHA